MGFQVSSVAEFARLNFTLQITSSWTSEKLKEVLDRNGLEIHVLQQHANKVGPPNVMFVGL